MEPTTAPRDEVQDLNRNVEKLLSAISHDLREPARTIRSFAQLLASGGSDPLDEKRTGYLQRINQAALRLEMLLEGLLSYSRAQRLIHPNRLIDGQELVDKAVRRQAHRINERRAVVRTTGPFPKLHVDLDWCLEAVGQLIDNAIKFTPEDAVPDVEIAAYEPHAGESLAGIVVRDRGSGVPADQQERIFELFQRAVGRQIEGVGVGLTLVREVARQHGGNAWVAARPDGGSDFFFTLAIEPPPQAY